jgi:hypothetical protein
MAAASARAPASARRALRRPRDHRHRRAFGCIESRPTRRRSTIRTSDSDHDPTALADAFAVEKPLVTPLAHDALSARLIERAGFMSDTLVALGGHAVGRAPMGPDPRAEDRRRILDDGLELARWQAIERGPLRNP